MPYAVLRCICAALPHRGSPAEDIQVVNRLTGPIPSAARCRFRSAANKSPAPSRSCASPVSLILYPFASGKESQIRAAIFSSHIATSRTLFLPLLFLAGANILSLFVFSFLRSASSIPWYVPSRFLARRRFIGFSLAERVPPREHSSNSNRFRRQD